MSIPLKLFWAISLERKSVFRDVRSDVLSERNKMEDSIEIILVDKNDFVKEGEWYFLSENSHWEINSTLCGRLGNRRSFPSTVKNSLSEIGISQPTP